ncbi:MAG: YhbY family RNA-binding protein [Planctomycetaceae bacterium]|nr:YhbY family RNA-binding protein [Planctomycetaceae bacterium]
MDELPGNLKRQLRSQGRSLSPLATIGKSGLTDAGAANLRGLLDKHELIKVRLPALPPDERAELAAQTAQAAGAKCVAIVGHTILLYKDPLTAEHAEDAEEEREEET